MVQCRGPGQPGPGRKGPGRVARGRLRSRVGPLPHTSGAVRVARSGARVRDVATGPSGRVGSGRGSIGQGKREHPAPHYSER